MNFATARHEGKEFCFIRAGRGIPGSGTDSVTGLDKNWETYIAGAKAAGFTRGAYWRFFPSRSLPTQVNAFSARAKILELPPMVDIEDAEGIARVPLTDWAIQVLNGVEQQTGVIPLLYTNKSFLADRLDALRVARWPLALARWTEDPTWPDDRAVYWQYTGNSRVPWATGPVDFQRSRKDSRHGA